MLANQMYAARLWAFLAQLFNKSHLRVDGKAVEISVHHTVAVEVDLAPIAVGDRPVITGRI